jgi:hypothetical protein
MTASPRSRAKRLILGIAMLAMFVAGLIVMFMPIFGGQNALEYLDSLYNSISKGSADYIPALEENVAQYEGSRFAVTLDMKDAELAQAAAALFEKVDATVEIIGTEVKVNGDLAQTLRSCLTDSRQMLENESKSVEVKYGREGKEALFAWWSALKAMDKDLKRQNRFAEAALVSKVKKKAVECAYNYYGIEPMKLSDNLGIVIFSLAFYVFYTVWYGYAIILVFEGCGLWLSH